MLLDLREIIEVPGKSISFDRDIKSDNLAVDSVKAFITDKQRNKLEKLFGFKFKKHPRYNWDERRLRVIEKVICNRARYLFELR